jgi:hemoglobin
MKPRHAALGALFIVVTTASIAGAPGASLYERLGGTSKVTAVVNQTIDRFATDERARIALRPADIQPLKTALLARICAVTGGGCTSPGLDIDSATYPVLVDALRGAMRAQDVPLAARNELLEVLVPMPRDVAKR